MGGFSRAKGKRFENDAKNALKALGVPCERVPLSGAAGGSFTGDLNVAVRGENWKAECKVRAYGFKALYGWLGKNRLLFVKEDRCDTLVMMRLADFAALTGIQIQEPAE